MQRLHSSALIADLAAKAIAWKRVVLFFFFLMNHLFLMNIGRVGPPFVSTSPSVPGTERVSRVSRPGTKCAEAADGGGLLCEALLSRLGVLLCLNKAVEEKVKLKCPGESF